MFKADALEATPILQRALKKLLGYTPTTGRAGSDLRTACGDLSANAAVLIQSDQVGPPLAECFDLARATNISQKQLAGVRNYVAKEKPVL